MGFLSSCDGNQGIPLEWKQGSQVHSRVAAESGLLLSCIRNSGVLLYLLLETWGFLESCHRGLRAPLEVQREISVPLDLQHGMQDCWRIVAWSWGSP